LTWVISSGGKTARAARALQILDSLDPSFAEAFSPAPDRLARHPQPLADLGVGGTLGRHQHDLRPQHLTVRTGVAGGTVLELSALLVGERDLAGAASRHRPKVRRLTRRPFKRVGISGGEH
jgi:hypothetical protein